MKFVKLLGHAYVHGTLRAPTEGVLHLEDDEANRLIEGELAEDVSEDFSSADDAEVPAAHLTADAEATEAAASETDSAKAKAKA